MIIGTPVRNLTDCALICVKIAFCDLIGRAQILARVQKWYGNVTRPSAPPPPLSNYKWPNGGGGSGYETICNIECWDIMCTCNTLFRLLLNNHRTPKTVVCGQIEFPILLLNSRKRSGTRSNSSSSIHVRNQSPRPFADLT